MIVRVNTLERVGKGGGERERGREIRSTRARISRSIWIITCTTTCQIIQSRDTRRPVELNTFTCASVSRVRACVRACVSRVRSHVGIGGQEGAPGVVRGRHVFAVAVTLYSSFIIARLDIVLCSLNEIRETPLRFTDGNRADLNPAIHSSASLDYRLPATGPP